MSTVLLALSEALRTLSLADDYPSSEKLSLVIDYVAEYYASELDLPDERPFLESFELVRRAITSRPMGDEDELVVKIFAHNLSVIEDRHGLDKELIEDKFIKRIEELLGDDFTNLVVMLVRLIKEQR